MNPGERSRASRSAGDSHVGLEWLVQDGNPIIADVHEGTAYLYTCHDEASPDVHHYVMKDWLCFSSTNLTRGRRMAHCCMSTSSRGHATEPRLPRLSSATDGSFGTSR